MNSFIFFPTILCLFTLWLWLWNISNTYPSKPNMSNNRRCISYFLHRTENMFLKIIFNDNYIILQRNDIMLDCKYITHHISIYCIIDCREGLLVFKGTYFSCRMKQKKWKDKNKNNEMLWFFFRDIRFETVGF